jgi:hypothetical protein
VKRLSDISKKVDDIFQGIRTTLADIVIGKTVSKDLRVIPDSRDDAASLPTITFEIY